MGGGNKHPYYIGISIMGDFTPDPLVHTASFCYCAIGELCVPWLISAQGRQAGRQEEEERSEHGAGAAGQDSGQSYLSIKTRRVYTGKGLRGDRIIG